MPGIDTEIAVARELFGRYTKAVAEHGWLFVLAIALVALMSQRKRFALRHERWARGVLVAAVAAFGCVYAWSLIWAADDSYISFRYAENLAGGHGLVFNPGERIEGYTDFLWTVIIAGFVRAGADPGQAAIVLSLVSFVLVIALSARLPQRLSAVPLVIGPAPLLCASNYTMASFATAGLETMFAALLVLVACERVEARRPFAGGLAAIFATMAHPDHAIFYAALAGAIAVDRRLRRDLVFYLAPFALVFVPYFLWRWSYYGDLMPNTYYAKSAGRAHFDQGTLYLLTTFIGGGLALAVPLACVGAVKLRRTVSGRFALIGVPLYVTYVAKIGGDFMLGRLFVPVFVLVFVFADVGFRLLLAEGRRMPAATLVVPAALAAFPIRIVGPGELFHGIADERSFTPVRSFSTMLVDAGGYVLGHAMFRAFSRAGPHLLVGLYNIGMPGYYSRVPVFDLRGLTSRSVAHLPVKERGRPGHEKLASAGHAVQAGVTVSQAPVYPPPYEGFTQISIEGFPFFLVHYEPGLVRKLRASHATAQPPERLEAALTRFSGMPPETAQCHLWFLREYYFASNSDGARRARIAASAALADDSLKPLTALLLDPRDPSSQGFTELRTIPVDPITASWSASGSAAEWTHEATLPEQGLPIGATSPVVNTCTPREVDRSIGSLESRPFVVEGDVMTFQVAGGMDAKRLTVALVVDGKPVRSATGCQTEWLGARVWDLSPFRGKEARVVVTDASRAPFGHLVVGAIKEWRAPP